LGQIDRYLEAKILISFDHSLLAILVLCEQRIASQFETFIRSWRFGVKTRARLPSPTSFIRANIRLVITITSFRARTYAAYFLRIVCSYFKHQIVNFWWQVTSRLRSARYELSSIPTFHAAQQRSLPYLHIIDSRNNGGQGRYTLSHRHDAGDWSLQYTPHQVSGHAVRPKL
jgi:hypothetical protein